MNILLLRHGETEWNREGRLQGHRDVPLNANGRLQVSRAAEILAGLYPDIERIISSPLSRALESAEIVAGKLKYEKVDIILEPMLIERSFGVGEGMTAAEREQKYPDGAYPEMESLEDLVKRAHSAFDKIVQSSGGRQTILVVAHGALFYAMMTAITDGRLPYGAFEPGSIHLIRYRSGTIEFAAYREDAAAFVEITDI